jgi:natural product precursor
MKIKKKKVLSFAKATIADLNNSEMYGILGGSGVDCTWDCGTDDKACHYETEDTLYFTCDPQAC